MFREGSCDPAPPLVLVWSVFALAELMKLQPDDRDLDGPAHLLLRLVLERQVAPDRRLEDADGRRDVHLVPQIELEDRLQGSEQAAGVGALLSLADQQVAAVLVPLDLLFEARVDLALATISNTLSSIWTTLIHTCYSFINELYFVYKRRYTPLLLRLVIHQPLMFSMEVHFISFIIPAFIAGLLTFLAPCTFPLVPGFLGFIAGVSAKELQGNHINSVSRKQVLKNGLMYVIGFSTVFILLGSLFGAAGSFLAPYRIWLARIGGVVIIFFGLYLTHLFDLKFLSFLSRQTSLSFTKKLTPGKPLSSFVFGATFAFGWTPCVGPVLGTILLLASTSGKVWEGAFLLLVFSIGLAIPFMLLALGVGHAQAYVKKVSKVLHAISIIGGLFLILIGVLLVTDSFGVWIGMFYKHFNVINANRLLDYL